MLGQIDPNMRELLSVDPLYERILDDEGSSKMLATPIAMEPVLSVLMNG